MSKYGPRIDLPSVRFASGVTSTSAIDLGDNTYTYLAVKFASMTTAAELTVYGCPGTSGSAGTYSPIYERVNTAPVQYQALIIQTATSGGWAVFQCPPFRYIQLFASAAPAGGGTVYFAASD